MCKEHINLYPELVQEMTDWLYFSYFVSRKQDLMFHANCLRWRQICIKYQVLFPGKNKGKYFKMLSAEIFTQLANDQY